MPPSAGAAAAKPRPARKLRRSGLHSSRTEKAVIAAGTAAGAGDPRALITAGDTRYRDESIVPPEVRLSVHNFVLCASFVLNLKRGSLAGPVVRAGDTRG